MSNDRTTLDTAHGATAARERWWRDADPAARRSLVAAGAGWALDAMDVALYTFALTAIKAEFGLDSAWAGALASVTLVAAAIGGTASGFLADRFGRSRMLMVSILVYSTCTALTATAGSVWALVLWRSLVGLGMGAEWSAGAVLVAETWPARHRGKAVGLMQAGWAVGTILAAGLAIVVLPNFGPHGWRWLFVVGVLPALLVVWIRRRVPEPAAWREARATLAAAAGDGAPRSSLAAFLVAPTPHRVVLATTTAALILCAYWGLFTWLPTFLARPKDQGGAGLGMLKGAAWIVPMQVGAFFGYACFGFLADRYGRRPMFVAFVLAAAAMVPVFAWSARLGGGAAPVAMIVAGPVLGFFGHGYFSVFGSMLAELFPSSIRGAAQGTCYNLGRLASAAAPIAIGRLGDAHGLGPALGLCSVLYVLGAGLVMTLPETRGRELR